jgi:hypothetical protein
LVGRSRATSCLSFSDWGITASSDDSNGSFLEAGTTYTSNPNSNLPYIQVLADGGGCPQIPKGSFRPT